MLLLVRLFWCICALKAQSLFVHMHVGACHCFTALASNSHLHFYMSFATQFFSELDISLSALFINGGNILENIKFSKEWHLESALQYCPVTSLMNTHGTCTGQPCDMHAFYVSHVICMCVWIKWVYCMRASNLPTRMYLLLSARFTISNWYCYSTLFSLLH